MGILSNILASLAKLNKLSGSHDKLYGISNGIVLPHVPNEVMNTSGIEHVLYSISQSCSIRILRTCRHIKSLDVYTDLKKSKYLAI